MYCAQCSRELRIDMERVGFDSRRRPIFHHFAYCDFCQTKQDLDLGNNTQSFTYSANTASNGYPIAGFTPTRSYPPAYNQNPQFSNSPLPQNKGTGILFPLAVAFFLIGILVMIGIGKSYSKSKNNTTTANVTISQNSTQNNNVASPSSDPGITVSPNDSLKVGDIGVINNMYVGLAYVKRMSYLPGFNDKYDDIGPDREVILAFFDFYNDSNSYASAEPYSITCYVDGYQVEDVNLIRRVKCDGILQYSKEKIADHGQMISVQDFDVPVNWKEIKLYYKSECVWTVHQEDVKSEEYVFQTMYPNLTITRTPVRVGDIVFHEDYDIIFQGVTEYTDTNRLYGDRTYIIFKYTIHNTGKTPINYEKAGYRMKAYQNNYFIGDANYTIDEQIDGYSNIYNIDSIEPGMSANIYLAFDRMIEMKNCRDYYMIYNDGYNSDKIRATVFYTE